MAPLCFANPSPPSGWIGDFHPQAIEHAGHTTRPPCGHSARPMKSVLLQYSGFSYVPAAFVVERCYEKCAGHWHGFSEEVMGTRPTHWFSNGSIEGDQRVRGRDRLKRTEFGRGHRRHAWLLVRVAQSPRQRVATSPRHRISLGSSCLLSSRSIRRQ